jgi:hypothetical protein
MRLLLILAVMASAAAAVACGGDDDGDAAPPVTLSTPASTPTENPLEDTLGALQRLTLAVQDVPPGFELESSQPVSKGEAVAANAGLPVIAGAIDESSLIGAWATFYLRDEPQTGLSSIVYLYPAPGDGASLVDAFAGLTTDSYPAATSIELLPSDTVGDRSQLMVYVIPGGRITEMTWVQGRYAGQVILRYAGETGDPGDAALVASLARRQSERMAAAP